MECTQCAMPLTPDANFCPRCGQAAQPEIRKAETPALAGVTASSGIPAPPNEIENEIELALAEAVRANTLVGGLSGKVLTSPFPGLPESPSAAGLPASKLSGQAIHALLAQANLHRMRQRWEEAVDCCVSVLRAQPANQSAHVLLGDIYRDQRRLDDAIQWYGMAVDLRPNPTDQAKLEQAIQERERQERLNVLRIRKGYGDSSPTPIDRGTDLNTGTVNLMGISPRRWLRGITATSLAFVALVLLAMVWTGLHRNRTLIASGTRTRAPFGNGSFDMPPAHLDKTPPSYRVDQAANGDKSVIIGGTGLAPDRNTRSATINPTDRRFVPAGGQLPPMSPGSARTPMGMNTPPNIPPAPVEQVRPLPPTSSPASSSGVSSTSQSSNRLTDGLELTRTMGDGGVGATVLLTGAPGLVLEGSARSQQILIRNVYRAARTALANSNMLMRVKVLIQTQTATAGQAVVLEAEVDRVTATGANPDTDDAATLQSRLTSFRYTGGSATAPAASTPVEGGVTQ